MPPQGVGPGKCPTQHFLCTVSFSLFSARWCHSHWLSITAPSALLSLMPGSLSLAPPFLSFWLSYFITISPFSAGLIFISSMSQMFSALSLAAGPFWVRVSRIIYSAGLLAGYSGFLLGFQPVRPEMGQQGEELSSCSGNWVMYFEEYGNQWAPMSSGNEWVFMIRRCAQFCFSDEKRLTYPVDSTSLEDIRKTRGRDSQVIPLDPGGGRRERMSLVSSLSSEGTDERPTRS